MGGARVGEVAERTGLSLRTIRHDVEIGLVAPSDGTVGGFRVYTGAGRDELAVWCRDIEERCALPRERSRIIEGLGEGLDRGLAAREGNGGTMVLQDEPRTVARGEDERWAGAAAHEEPR